MASKRSIRDVSSDGHNLPYSRTSLTTSDPVGSIRNRRGGGAALPTPPVGTLVPAGTLVLFVGGTNPDATNYSIADGSALSRTTYSSLYSAVGTTFGSGDGSTTFNLPNLTGHLIRSNTTPGTTSTLSAPSHSHGALVVAAAPSSSGNTADANNSVRNAVNNASTSATGNASSYKSRDHDVLPLVSLRDCQLPVGALLYTFRDLTKARTYCTCLDANGSAYSASTYPDLYTVTSTSYGGTAASPNRPDFRGCFPKCNKTYTPGNNYSLDAIPQHNHGPWTGVDANSTTISTRQDGSVGSGNFSANGTTNSAGTGNATEARGTNFAAHPVIVANNASVTVQGLGSFVVNFLEAGDLIFYLGTTAPSNKFKALTGGDPLSTTTYPTLSTSLESNFVNGSNIDVLSCADRYLRGVDGSAGRDPDAASRTFGGTGTSNGATKCGTFQSQSFTGHTHTFYASSNNAGQNSYPNYGNIPFYFQNSSTINTYGLNYNANVTVNTATDVRFTDIKVNTLMVLET